MAWSGLYVRDVRLRELIPREGNLREADTKMHMRQPPSPALSEAEGGCPVERDSAQPRKSGRVKQVGPPLPLIQISLPGNVRTSNPA